MSVALSSFTEKSVDPEGTQLVPGTGLMTVRPTRTLNCFKYKEYSFNNYYNKFSSSPNSGSEFVITRVVMSETWIVA